MNQNLTEIAFILDRSGSMQSMVAAAINGFNHFLIEQQTTPGDANLTLILFDDQYQVLHAAKPIREVPKLDGNTFVPRGSTALLDAIGRTIDELGFNLTHISEQDRPGKVIVAILTDGEENSSVRFTNHDIFERIRHQESTYSWEFLFLGANQDAIATAGRLGISANNSATYTADTTGQFSAAAAMSTKTRALRKMAQGTATVEEQAAAAAPTSSLYEKEDKARRGK